jgi:hypothetical protein
MARALAITPDWLLELARRPAGGRRPATPTRRSYAAMLAGVSEGERHVVATQLVGHLRAKGLPPEEIMEILIGWAARCTPPHDEDDTRRIVQDLADRPSPTPAPDFQNPGRPVFGHPHQDVPSEKDSPQGEVQTTALSPGPRLELTPIIDLLAEAEPATTWVVPERIRTGTLSIVAGPPYAGKSTLLRSLSGAVSGGTPWLGFPSRKGLVYHLGFQDNREELKGQFQRLGVGPAHTLSCFVDRAPQDAVEALAHLVKIERPVLVVIDLLINLLHVTEVNDYGRMLLALEPLLSLARQTGTAIVASHHTAKGLERDPVESLLGSTAIAGTVDTVFFISATTRHRTIWTVQRYGTPLAPRTLLMDPETGQLSLGESPAMLDRQALIQSITEHLGRHPRRNTTQDIVTVVQAKRGEVLARLRELVAEGTLRRHGIGKKHDPYRYELPR